MISQDERQIELARMLITRLERLSVDSYWAHHASGARRSLVRFFDELPAATTTLTIAQRARLEALMQRGFGIIERGAREMGDRH